jgi:hypothetical protein
VGLLGSEREGTKTTLGKVSASVLPTAFWKINQAGPGAALKAERR